jgi:hypothetical protein
MGNISGHGDDRIPVNLLNLNPDPVRSGPDQVFEYVDEKVSEMFAVNGYPQRGNFSQERGFHIRKQRKGPDPGEQDPGKCIIVISTGKDLLILYMDGITEAENAQLEMFGLERLKVIILASRALSSTDIIEAIITAVRTFTGDYPQSDDITMMVIRSR